MKLKHPSKKEKPYNEDLVHGFVGLGVHHLIRRYGKNSVIKFPVGIPFRLNPKQWCRNLKRDSQVLEKHFGAYLSKAEVYFFSNGAKYSYVIIEPFCEGRHLRKEDLRDSNIRAQLVDIVERNSQMMLDEHISLDFFGAEGLLWKGRREVCNIMLEAKTRQLRIIDVAALHFGNTQDQQTVVSLLTDLALLLQRRLLKKLLAS